MSGTAIGHSVPGQGLTYQATIVSCGVFDDFLSVTLLNLDPSLNYDAEYTADLNGVPVGDGGQIIAMDGWTDVTFGHESLFGAGCLSVTMRTIQGTGTTDPSPFSYYVTF